MNISLREFEILKSYVSDNVNKKDIISSDEKDGLFSRGLLCEDGITPYGRMILESFKVNNAIILAAGAVGGTFSPPKGLIEVHGVPLVERQIQQLQEVGISDIVIIVGEKKEMYLYLSDKYGVKIVGNPDRKKNNIYSMYLCKEYFGRTYICPCDYYYRENPFSLYEYTSYHATSFFDESSDKFSIKINSKSRIVHISRVKCKGECLHGFAFFDEEFSKSFKSLLERDIDKFLVSNMFWEDYWGRNLEELDMYAKHFESQSILEFDSLDELNRIDSLFIDGYSKIIKETICKQLNVEEKDIYQIEILEKGHSNITFKINVANEDYVYRYPGQSGQMIVSRIREQFAEKIAFSLGIDKTLIYIGEDGHKISKYVPNAGPLKFSDEKQLAKLVELVRTYHGYKLSDEEREQYSVDPVVWADSLLDKANNVRGNLYEIFDDIIRDVHKLSEYTAKDNFAPALCHGNLNANNCLVTDTDFNLIDWEFTAVCDPAFDYPFHDDYLFYENEMEDFLNLYYQRKPTFEEWRHWYAYRAIENYFYLCWALLKESLNEDAGNLMLSYYSNLRQIVKKALDMYEK